MALGYTPGTGATVASDQRGGEHLQVLKDGGYDSVASGRKTVTSAGTAEQISASSVPCKRVDICAEVDNTGVIVIGGSGVIALLATRTGVPLNAGEFISVGIADLNAVWLDATVSGDGVTYNYYL